MTPPAVLLRDVFCVHRTPAGDAASLQGLDLELAAGERLCVLGPSGAGKTTLLRVIAGLQMPSAGRVEVFGQDPGRMSARRRARMRHDWIGFVGQHAETALSPDLRIADAVALPLMLRGRPREACRARVGQLLDAAGLAACRDRRPGELSGGERQRAAVCVALAHAPRLLLADEPTAELDALAAAALADVIETLARDDGATVLTVSHDPALAERAPRTVLLRDGRVAEDRRDGRGPAIVVGRDGWLRVPPELLQEAGISSAARVTPSEAGLLLTGTGVRAQSARRGGRGGGRARARHTPAVVAVRDLVRRRGGRAVLEDLSISFAPGRLTVITGRSGTGKTTLLELLAGIDRPDGGEVTIGGSALAGLDADGRAAVRRRLVGYLPQEPAPVAFLTAAENVALSLRLRGVAPAVAREAAAAALGDVGLGDRAEQRVGRLSAGEAQRVALARALAAAQGLLIVDEPTSRLDRRLADAVAALLHRAAADGHTVICATHDATVVDAADELVALGPALGAPAPIPAPLG